MPVSLSVSRVLLILFLVFVLLPCSPVKSDPAVLLNPACKSWFALHETPLLHNMGSLAQELPRGPGRAVVGVWAAPIKVAGFKPGFAGFALARPGASFLRRHWLVENGSLGRRYRLKPAWVAVLFLLGCGKSQSATPIRSACVSVSPSAAVCLNIVGVYAPRTNEAQCLPIISIECCNARQSVLVFATATLSCPLVRPASAHPQTKPHQARGTCT